MIGDKNHTRVFEYKSASVRIRKTSYNEAVLTNLFSEEKQKGHATEVMKLAMAYADAEGLKLTLIVQGYFRQGEEGLTNKQLVAFYSKFGFKRIVAEGRGIIMMERAL